jgi:thioredoxin-like negative regulator of GroEL
MDSTSDFIASLSRAEWKKLAVDLKGEVNVADVDATQNPELAERFSLRGFPTLKLIRY